MKISELEELLKPVVQNAGYGLWDIVFVKEGANWYLRLFIDKPNAESKELEKLSVVMNKGDEHGEGIGISDCETVSRLVGKVLDDVDPIKQPYILEVSSPGLDRALKRDRDFELYAGHLVNIKLYKPNGKKKSFSGELKGIVEGKIVIKDEKGAELLFDKALVASCRLAVVW
ncbi:MAG: ribosome maturation factor RimP [Clostridiales bacterium]|jgi:ribosome maturation factor RimP|nr:ribosome maturation factor RimP [Clostridiales bacterium]